MAVDICCVEIFLMVKQLNQGEKSANKMPNNNVPKTQITTEPSAWLVTDFRQIRSKWKNETQMQKRTLCDAVLKISLSVLFLQSEGRCWT